MTLRSMGKSDSAPKRGMTLVELLIVISITVLIAAVVLPTVKTLLKDRKGNQAALQLRAFIQAAQARAIGRNREVAVVLERNTKYGDNYTNRNAVIRLSLAEVLPPYRGDLENSTVALSACPTAPYNTGNINQATINLGLNATARHFVNIGDRIAFDDHPERFEIVDFSPKDASGKVPVGTPMVNVIFWNQPYNYAYAGTSRQSTSPRGPIVNLIPGDHKFRIYSRPRRLFSKPLDMPKGTCIDLSVSGVGQAGYGFASDTINPASPLPVEYFKPVYLLFNPSGALSVVYGNAPASPNMERYIPTSSVYLMVGKVEQVAPVRSYADLTGAVSENDTYTPNISDFGSYWVKISPDSGQIALSPNLDPSSLPNTSTFPEMLLYSRGLSSISAETTSR